MEGLFLPLVMVAMIGFMFFSQRKQQKQRQDALSQIKKGDEIVTIGGLFGIVDEIDEQKVVLDVDGVYLTFERNAIRNRVSQVATVVEETVVTEEVVSEETPETVEEAVPATETASTEATDNQV